MILPWHQPEFQRLLQEGAGLPHALLIRGPEGIGKLEFARSLAEALLCEEAQAGRAACGHCSSCEWIAQGTHPDFRVVEPDSIQAQEDEEPGDRKKGSTQINVDQVRALTDFVSLSSHRGQSKVILVHPAEAMNTSAANALLKSLEEPPPATYFLLVAHRWHQLPATIKSRCRQVVLAPPDRESARDWLAEQGTAQAELALAHAGGAPLSAARHESEYWEQRAAFLAAITTSEFDPLRAAEQLRDLALPDLVKWLQQWSYDMAFHRASGRVRYHPDFEEQVGRAAGRTNMLDTLRFHRQMVRWQRVVNHPLNPRLFLEELLLSYGALVSARRPRQMQ